VFGSHLLDVDDFVSQLLEGHCNVFGRGVTGQMPDNSLYWFGFFGVKGEEGREAFQT
jgi:hypothetical protein